MRQVVTVLGVGGGAEFAGVGVFALVAAIRFDPTYTTPRATNPARPVTASACFPSVCPGAWFRAVELALLRPHLCVCSEVMMPSR
ncbi:hypothetical protein OG601_34450 [Streptomyces sp. NBC_01239]|uniref:hypothetical protein n=1 Tax=Streptomyces sp. NBC_01239 TaxID=2903792 RepID=UPI00225B532A|nr:hypothetical protein [Streptomyces sp. NBC_01239]MCX4815706.1 hypothetical protein [Streptomyces sp. NBC_01239]